MDNPRVFSHRLVGTLCVALSGVYARSLLRMVESPHVSTASAVAAAGALAFTYVTVAEAVGHA